MDHKFDIGYSVGSFEQYSEFGPITGVSITADENEFFSGSEGYILELDCPYGTQDMADEILSQVEGKTYLGFHAADAQLGLDAELGDSVSLCGITSVLAYQQIEFSPGHVSEISAPGGSELDHEYTYVSTQSRQTERKIAENRALISKTSEEIKLQVENVDGRVSTLSQTVDGFTAQISDLDMDVTAKLELKIDKTDTDQVVSMINAAADKIDLESDELTIKSGQFTLEKGVATFRGAIGAEDESEAYVDVASDGLNIRMKDGTIVCTIGYNSNEMGWIYPYMIFGRGNTQEGSSGLIKKFGNGVWFGTSGQRDSVGVFSPKEGDYGFFLDIDNKKMYVVQNTSMQNLYTGEAIARFG